MLSVLIDAEIISCKLIDIGGCHLIGLHIAVCLCMRANVYAMRNLSGLITVILLAIK